MLKTQESQFVNPGVKKLLTDIQKENSRYERELRSVKRERIVLPVIVTDQNDSSFEANGFTRDLSVAGTCVVANFNFQIGQRYILDIYRLDGSAATVLSECRWAKPFGPSFWVSGWQFLQIARNELS